VIYLSTYTKNFRLKKPELTDTADLTQYNESWDKVDSTLKEHADKLNNTLGKLSVNGKTPNSNGEITLTADDVNAATEEFVEDYVEDKLALVTGKPLEENSISGKVITSGTLPADRLEGSLPITKGGTGATSASSAREALGITPENIGAVPLDGSVSMTGDLQISKKSKPAVKLIDVSTSGETDATGGVALRSSMGVSLSHYDKESDKTAELQVTAGSTNPIKVKVEGVDYNLFGEHNTDLLKNYVLPLDGSVPMSGALDIVQKSLPSVTLYTGETKDTATEQVRFRQAYGYLNLSHRDNSTGDETSLQISGKKGFTPIKVIVDDEPYALFGEHNPDLLKNYVLPLDGSVPVTGNLTIERPNWLGVKLRSTDSGREGRLTFSGNNNETQVVNYTDDNNLSFLKLNKETYNLSSMVELAVKKEGNTANYKIFGEHNKPTGFYSGNGSAEQRTIPIGGVGSILWIKSAKYLTFVWNFGGFTLDGVNGSVKFHPSSQLDFEDGVLTIASTHSAINDSTNVHYYGYVG
jgi:hypothetical protein